MLAAGSRAGLVRLVVLFAPQQAWPPMLAATIPLAGLLDVAGEAVETIWETVPFTNMVYWTWLSQNPTATPAMVRISFLSLQFVTKAVRGD